jgi:hypothetical protein
MMSGLHLLNAEKPTQYAAVTILLGKFVLVTGWISYDHLHSRPGR